MDKNLYKKVLAGQCSPEELRRFIKWLQSEDAEFEFSQEIERLWSEYQVSDQEPFNKAKLYDRILKRIGASKESHIVAPFEPNSSRPKSYVYYKIAASFLIVASLGLGLLKTLSTINEGEANDVQREIVKTASRGQKSTVFLPDGSRVRLNSDSEIRFMSEFSDSARTVYLEGEAYFEVYSDSLRPFVVISKNLATIVLGTSFNVQAYPEDREIKVSLTSGRVKIKQNDSHRSQVFELFLEPGYQAIYNTQKSTIRKAEFDPRQTLSWKDNILYFEDAEWGEIVEQLERWYGVHIIVENEIYEDKLYSGEFKDAALKNVLESLSFTKGFDYQIKENKIIIKFHAQN